MDICERFSLASDEKILVWATLMPIIRFSNHRLIKLMMEFTCTVLYKRFKAMPYLILMILHMSKELDWILHVSCFFQTATWKLNQSLASDNIAYSQEKFQDFLHCHPSGI